MSLLPRVQPARDCRKSSDLQFGTLIVVPNTLSIVTVSFLLNNPLANCSAAKALTPVPVAERPTIPSPNTLMSRL